MQNERNNGWRYPVEDCRHPREAAEVHVESAERCNDDEVRQNEGPTAGPCAPEPTAQIRDKDANLYRQWAWKRLADRDRVAHFLLRKPPFALYQLLFHQAAKRDRRTETYSAEPEEISDELKD